MGVEVPEVEADGAAEACDEAEPLSREDWEVLRLQTTKKMKMKCEDKKGQLS